MKNNHKYQHYKEKKEMVWQLPDFFLFEFVPVLWDIVTSLLNFHLPDE